MSGMQTTMGACHRGQVKVRVSPVQPRTPLLACPHVREPMLRGWVVSADLV